MVLCAMAMTVISCKPKTYHQTIEYWTIRCSSGFESNSLDSVRTAVFQDKATWEACYEGFKYCNLDGPNEQTSAYMFGNKTFIYIKNYPNGREFY